MQINCLYLHTKDIMDYLKQLKIDCIFEMDVGIPLSPEGTREDNLKEAMNFCNGRANCGMFYDVGGEGTSFLYCPLNEEEYKLKESDLGSTLYFKSKLHQSILLYYQNNPY